MEINGCLKLNFQVLLGLQQITVYFTDYFLDLLINYLIKNSKKEMCITISQSLTWHIHIVSLLVCCLTNSPKLKDAKYTLIEN